MNLDLLTTLSSAQVVTGNANSTNAYDSATTQGMLTGIGEPMECVITVSAATMNGQSCTCVLYADDDNNGTNKTTIGQVVIPSTVTVPAKFIIDIPGSDDANNVNAKSTNRYYYLTYTFSGTSITLTAILMPDDMVSNNNVYPKSGYTIK